MYSSDLVKRYYSKKGEYLKEHEPFLHSANIDKDIDFLIRALNIKREDTILDIACGQGRHVNAFAKRGFHIDGVDFSRHLLACAKRDAGKQLKIRPSYFYSNVENLKLQKKYSKAYWFFSDLANIDLPRAIASIYRVMKPGGKVLFDTDSIFRIVSYLKSHPQTDLIFNESKSELIDKRLNAHVSYPILEKWTEWFLLTGFSVKQVVGNYDFSKYDANSRRLIIIVEKTA